MHHLDFIVRLDLSRKPTEAERKEICQNLIDAVANTVPDADTGDILKAAHAVVVNPVPKPKY